MTNLSWELLFLLGDPFVSTRINFCFYSVILLFLLGDKLELGSDKG